MSWDPPELGDEKGSESATNAAAGTKHFNCLISPALHREFKLKTMQEDTTMSQVTIQLIKKYLNDEVKI